MNRRELIKAIIPVAGIPLLVRGQDVGRAFKVEPNAKYVVFLNADKIDPRDFADNATGLPPGTAVHAVFLNPNNPNDTMDSLIRIYKVDV